MITLSQLTELLGWASIINIAFLFVVFFALTVMKTTVTAIHSKMFGISKSELQLIYFKYMANYKTLTFAFFVAPYLALKFMGH
jgi:hypothetical protein